MNPRSFRTRLFLLVALVLVPTGALVLIANVDRQLSDKARLREQAHAASKLAAASQAYYVKQTRQLLTTIADFHFLVLSEDRDYCRKQLSNLKLLSPDFSDFGLIDPDGKVFCHTLEGGPNEAVISSSFIRRALNEPRFIMGDCREASLGQPSIQFAQPVIGTNQQVARFMYASLRLPLLSAALAEISLPEGGTVTVMDRSGNILARQPEPGQWVGKNISSIPFAHHALAGKTGVFEAEGLGGIKSVYAVSQVLNREDPVMFVQVAVPQKEMFAQADAEFGGSLVGLLLIGALVLTLAWWFSERVFLQPVKAVLGATKRLTEGDLSARAGIIKGKSELHVLAKRFDLMAEALGNRQRDLEEANQKITRNNAELERRVQERTSDLQALNSELEAFSYSVSHDLRAPLRHMNGFAELLKSDESLESNETARRYLGLITKSAKEMGALIDDLLAFSRMARKPMAVHCVDCAALVAEIVERAKAETPDRQIDWRIGPLPQVSGDAAMLRQAWVNLISNAVKYTRSKAQAIIEVSSSTGQGELIFAVADNGAGFDMKYADKLFGVFQRLHRDEEFEGTGIGLANVRRIIQRHGGRPWAKGEPGKGAAFYFSLPSDYKKA